MATSPDLPPPITPDLPDTPEPADLPVEPDQGSVTRFPFRLSLHLQAHRQFMSAACFRWTLGRTRAWIL